MGVGARLTYDTNTGSALDTEGQWRVLDGTTSITAWADLESVDKIQLHEIDGNDTNVRRILDRQETNGLIAIYIDSGQWIDYLINSVDTETGYRSFNVSFLERRQPDSPIDLPSTGDLDFLLSNGEEGDPGFPGVGSLIIYDVHTSIVPSAPGEWRIRNDADVVRDWSEVIDATDIDLYIRDQDDIDRTLSLDAQASDDLAVVRINPKQWASFLIKSIARTPENRCYTVEPLESRTPSVNPVVTIAEDSAVNFLFTKSPDGTPGESAFGRSLTYDDVLAGGNPSAGGEYKFSNVGTFGGSTSISDWGQVKDADFLFIYKQDKDDTDRSEYLGQIVVNDSITYYASVDQWAEYRVLAVVYNRRCIPIQPCRAEVK